MRVILWVVAFGALLLAATACHAETMLTSFYGAESGRTTASGATFHPGGLTAAHRTLPFGTRLRVCYVGCVVVVVNDRGPAAWTGRALDISQGAAVAVGMVGVGVARVTVTRE